MAFLPERFPPRVGKTLLPKPASLQLPWQQHRDPAPPSVARKTFNCPVVIGEKWEDSQEDHCLGNSTGAADSHLVHSVPHRAGHILGAQEKKVGAGPWGRGRKPAIWERALPAGYTIVEVLREKKAGPWLCLAGHRVKRKGSAGANCTKPEQPKRHLAKPPSKPQPTYPWHTAALPPRVLWQGRKSTLNTSQRSLSPGQDHVILVGQEVLYSFVLNLALLPTLGWHADLSLWSTVSEVLLIDPSCILEQSFL